jgi:hypothetical protein
MVCSLPTLPVDCRQLATEKGFFFIKCPKFPLFRSSWGGFGFKAAYTSSLRPHTVAAASSLRPHTLRRLGAGPGVIESDQHLISPECRKRPGRIVLHY